MDCYFSQNNIQYIDYKNADLLRRFTNEYGRIKGRKYEPRVCAKHQRGLARAIKNARYMGLLPYVSR